MRRTAQRALEIVEDELTTRPFIASGDYTIADMAMFAYGTCAEDVGIPLQRYPHFVRGSSALKHNPTLSRRLRSRSRPFGTSRLKRLSAILNVCI